MIPASRSAPRRISFEAVVGVLSGAVAVGLAFHLVRELASPRDMAATDFTVFRTGWSLILHGRVGELYDGAAQGTVQRALLSAVGSDGFQSGTMAFLHPPHAALAGCAFGVIAERFGTPIAFWLWTLGSLALLAQLVRLVRDELGGGPNVTALVAVTLAAFYPVLETLQQGQVSALLAVATLACVVAVRQRRAFAAACWLLALSVKPQTLPVVLIVLAARRERRVLGFAIALGAGVALVTTLCLGPHVWWDYVTRLPALERLFGVGTPDHMPTVRGVLTRLLGAPHREAIDAVTLAAWLGAMFAAGIVAVRGRHDPDARASFAFALAVGALASPHLFPQDVLLWAAPVGLVLALSRDESVEVWRQRARVVLVWPLWFVLARALDIRDTPQPRLPFDLTIVPLALVMVWAVRAAIGRRAAAS
ncbi:MAG TPA: glycosyltransferase family 87 protein [Polyangia bacterium]|nr:glycosyltransferase family 87 protein [Polyangia bacterium]